MSVHNFTRRNVEMDVDFSLYEDEIILDMNEIIIIIRLKYPQFKHISTKMDHIQNPTETKL